MAVDLEYRHSTVRPVALDFFCNNSSGIRRKQLAPCLDDFFSVQRETGQCGPEKAENQSGNLKKGLFKSFSVSITEKSQISSAYGCCRTSSLPTIISEGEEREAEKKIQ